MALSESKLRAVLEKAGVTCGPTRNDAIPVIYTSGDKRMIVAVRIDSGIVQFRTLGLVYARAAEYRGILLIALMACNSRYKMIKFAFDPNDGEVVGYIELVVENGRLHKSQVRRCITTLDLVIKCRERFEQILQLGSDPGHDAAWASEETTRINVDELMQSAESFDESSIPSFVDTEVESWADNTEAKSMSLTFSAMLNVEDKREL